MRSSAIRMCLLASLVTACAVPSEAEDGADDALATGKADASYSANELAGALRAANELSLAELDDEVGLSSRAATNIVEQRPFATVQELDAVPYVGPYAFAALVEYARDAGLIAAIPDLASVSPYALGSWGSRLAVTRNTLAIVTGPNNGDVHLYERAADGWTPQPALPRPGSHSAFAQAIALDGTTFVVTGNVAAQLQSPDYRTYVYEHGATGWTLRQTIPGGNRALALEGDILAIGDVVTTSGTMGTVRLYQRTNGTFQERATLSTGAKQFGRNLALRDGLLVIAAEDAGAYVVDLSAGTPASPTLQRLDVSVGYSVAASRDRIAVGDWTNAGTVSVFARVGDTWSRTTVIAGPPRLSANHQPLFGHTIAFDGTNLVVTSPNAGAELPTVLQREGSISVYDSTGSLLERRMGETPGQLGLSLAVNAGRFVVGGYNRVWSN